MHGSSFSKYYQRINTYLHIPLPFILYCISMLLSRIIFLLPRELYLKIFSPRASYQIVLSLSACLEISFFHLHWKSYLCWVLNSRQHFFFFWHLKVMITFSMVYILSVQKVVSLHVASLNIMYFLYGLFQDLFLWISFVLC